MCLGIPAQVVEITDPENLLARVSVGGVKREVNLACVISEGQKPEALLGEWVLVHVGFAMSRINPEEAAKTLALLAELGEFQNKKEAAVAKGKLHGG